MRIRTEGRKGGRTEGDQAEGRKAGRTEGSSTRAPAFGRAGTRRGVLPSFRPTVLPSSARPQLELIPGGLPASPSARPSVHHGTEFVQITPRSALNSPATTGMGFWSVNPYVGCEFGCSYCYARDTHRYTTERRKGQDGREEGRTDGRWPRSEAHLTSGSDDVQNLPSFRPSVLPPAFERLIYVKASLPDVLLRTLDPSKIGDHSIVIGTATDPYQPAERKFEVTRGVLKQLLKFRGLSIGIITKSPLVTRDIPILKELAERHEVIVNISLASVDALLIRRLERRSPLPLARLRALGKLTTAGIHAGLLIAPILPGITDDRDSLSALMIAGKAAGARFAAGFPLRLGSVITPNFIPVLMREFPELVERYRRHFRHGDYVTREYRDALMERILGLQVEYGYPTGPARHHKETEEPDVEEIQGALL